MSTLVVSITILRIPKGFVAAMKAVQFRKIFPKKIYFSY